LKDIKLIKIAEKSPTIPHLNKCKPYFLVYLNMPNYFQFSKKNLKNSLFK